MNPRPDRRAGQAPRLDLGLGLGLRSTSWRVAAQSKLANPRTEVPDLQGLWNMARPGLEPGTPRCSVGRDGLSNRAKTPAHKRGDTAPQGARDTRKFHALLGDSGDGRRPVARWVRERCLQTGIQRPVARAAVRLSPPLVNRGRPVPRRTPSPGAVSGASACARTGLARGQRASRAPSARDPFVDGETRTRAGDTRRSSRRGCATPAE
jgi:hypothetical protein